MTWAVKVDAAASLRNAAISAQLRIIPFHERHQGFGGPVCELCECQIGCGVACVSAAFKRARFCINKALRAWMSGDISPDSNSSFNS